MAVARPGRGKHAGSISGPAQSRIGLAKIDQTGGILRIMSLGGLQLLQRQFGIARNQSVISQGAFFIANFAGRLGQSTPRLKDIAAASASVFADFIAFSPLP